jgi:hypothetical protein
MSDEFDKQERQISRSRLRSIWEANQAGGLLSAEDAQRAQIMREHPQWRDRWEHADELSDDEFTAGHVNPSLHLVAHDVALNQINGAPPAAREVYEALLARGLDVHTAIHRIGSVMMEEVYEVHKNQRPSDPVDYERKLRALLARPARARRKHRPQRR